MPDGPLSKAGLHSIYQPLFHGSNLHHLIPRSRRGNGTEYNLFPYKIKNHSAYHEVFLNLRIDEVWNMLNDIHHSIFELGDDLIIPWWLGKCEREIGPADKIAKFYKSKNEMLVEEISVSRLQNKWFTAFGSEDLGTSKEFLKLMMLFMVFGKEMISRDTLFDNGNIADFLEESPCSNVRLWAFEKCFGQNGATTSSMKKRIVSIVDRYDYYAKVIL